MKTRHSSNGWLKLAGAVALVSIVALLSLTAEYAERCREIESWEHSAATTRKLTQVAHDNWLLQQIANGKTDRVKENLSCQLTANLQELCKALPANEEIKDVGLTYCIGLLRQQKAHPEYYLAPSAGAQIEQGRTWETIRKELMELADWPTRQ